MYVFCGEIRNKYFWVEKSVISGAVVIGTFSSQRYLHDTLLSRAMFFQIPTTIVLLHTLLHYNSYPSRKHAYIVLTP